MNNTLQIYPLIRMFIGPLSAKHPKLAESGQGRNGLSFPFLNPQQLP